jgi:hypothetical protein
MKAPGRREGVVTRVAVGVIVLAVLQTVSAQKPAAPSVGTVAAGQPIAGFEYDVTNQPKWQDLTSPQPKISLTFSVKRRDATFEALQQSGVSATISGSPITIHEFTTNTTPPPARVVLVLDGSLSMLPQGNAQTPAQLVGKLEPAKIAIIDFLENLLQRPDDAVAVWQFNQSSTPLFLMGSDKTDAIEAVDQFQIDRDTAGQDTFLYQALQDGLAYARAQGVQHLIFVTDGVEDTPDFNRKSTEEQAQHQRDQEQLALASSQDGAPIRVHTVAIGNRNADRRKDA